MRLNLYSDCLGSTFSLVKSPTLPKTRHGGVYMPVIQASLRWKQEDQKFKVILAYTRKFEDNLDNLRPCLKL